MRTAGERHRIRTVYGAYEAKKLHERLWSLRNPGYRTLVDQRDRFFVRLLKTEGCLPLAGRRILEVGCGTGGVLGPLAATDGSGARLFGVDIRDDAVFRASSKFPEHRFVLADGVALPFREHRFDLVIQFTMLSSVPDNSICQTIAGEMLRVVKPSGLVISYDVRYKNPLNRQTRPITRRNLRAFFPNCRIDTYPITLLPPLARSIGRFSANLCKYLEVIPWLKSHYFAVIRKKT